MGLNLVTGPTIEPIRLDELRTHLRITGTDDDVQLLELREVARRQLEDTGNLALITQTWDWYVDAFPSSAGTPLEPPRSPLSSVTSITYTDTNGDPATWASSGYQVDARSHRGRILPAYGEVYPTARDVPNAVTVRFVAGYGSDPAAVPRELRQWLLMKVADLFEHREGLVLDGSPSRTGVPDTLLASLRVHSGF